MSFRVVLDVNVLVSGVATPDGIPARLVDLGLEWSLFTVIVSKPMKDRLENVLLRRYFAARVGDEARGAFLALLNERAEWVEIVGAVSGVADDDEDDRILETALVGDADIIVTGDKGMLAIGEFRDIRILAPREFLIELEMTTRETTEGIPQ